MELMDIADSGKGKGKKLNKLSDFRVREREYRGKFTIAYPFGISKDMSLVNLYHKLTAKYINELEEI